MLSNLSDSPITSKTSLAKICIQLLIISACNFSLTRNISIFCWQIAFGGYYLNSPTSAVFLSDFYAPTADTRQASTCITLPYSAIILEHISQVCLTCVSRMLMMYFIAFYRGCIFLVVFTLEDPSVLQGSQFS